MEAFHFKKAKPIWAKGRTLEKNLHLSYKFVLKYSENTIIHLTGSTVYRLFMNGQFIAIGPARAAAGYYKVDTYNLTKYLSQGNNILVIEVVGYNVNSYYTLNQPSFLIAEVEQMGKVAAFTGGDSVKCRLFHERVQKVQRYSFQRPFAESYHLTEETQNFRTCQSMNDPIVEQECITDKTYICRDVRYPEYEVLYASKIEALGVADFSYQCRNIKEDRAYNAIGDTLLGYNKKELEEHLSTEYQNIFFDIEDIRIPIQMNEKIIFRNNKGTIISFPYNATGMIAFDIKCSETILVYGLFDEILINNDIDTTRLDCCNGFKLLLEAGNYPFITFEPYTLKYLKILVKGECEIQNIRLVEYKHPSVPYKVALPNGNKKLRMIYDAALETYLSNAVDTFTDCPSRERAGWLCDSYFTARVEKCLTGENRLEKSFLENFIIAKDFQFLPKGMLPMCYPADHNDGVFIPNWAMWFVLEVDEYLNRTDDRVLIDQAKDRIYGLLNYFSKFENEFGLLEKLESWVFVEWSKAADFVQDVNYPTNMLYSKMLEIAGALYADELLIQKSTKLKNTIRKRSFNGKFFTDNEIRKANELVNQNNVTEVCQYYAFFTGVAYPETYSELWESLIKEFGPQRRIVNQYPEVYFANAFIGNYLRLEILYRYRYEKQLLREIEDYLYKMAVKTGTLWEHDTPEASCNHGFASHIIYWLASVYGLERV